MARTVATAMKPDLFTIAAIALLALAIPARAQDAAPPDPQARLDALLARYQAAEDKSDAAAALRSDFEALAKANPGTAAGLSARLWLLEQCWWLRTRDSEQPMERAAAAMLDTILAEYPDHPLLARIADTHFVFADELKAPLFERLLASSKHAEVRASMILRLGMLERRSKDPAVRERAARRFQQLLADYADVPRQATTYGAMADALLHPHTDLAIGKAAPEIVGTDTDGRAMKLSGFRGKVVVLDFWGFW